MVNPVYCQLWSSSYTLAVVLPHVLNAFEAASMAFLVSVRPKSATDPNSSPVAGSIDHVRSAGIKGNEARTNNRKLLAILRVDPFAVNESLAMNQTCVLQSELLFLIQGTLLRFMMALTEDVLAILCRDHIALFL